MHATLQQAQARPGNRLLAALPPEDLKRLWPHLEKVALAYRQTLLTPAEPIDHVYFPLQGMVSLGRPLEDGVVVEVALIGNDGMVGVPEVLGTRMMFGEAIVPIAGTALRMPAGEFRRELAGNPRFKARMLRYVHALFAQISQTAACNWRHTVEQRLAYWLLMAGDRASGNDFKISHDFLSVMLASRRASVTIAAEALRTAGLISNAHGHISVVDRPGLEAAACECYRTVSEEYRRALA